MDKKTIYIKTDKGENEATNLSSDLKRILSLIDNKSKADELAKRAPPSLRESWEEILGELLAGGYIVDKNRPHIEPKITKPKFNPLKMFSPKPAGMFVPRPAAQPPEGDLDFSAMNPTPSPDAAALAVKQKADAAQKARADFEAKQKVQAEARAELEASVAAAKERANAEAAAKAQAKAKLEAESAARARAETEAKAKQEALVRAEAEAKAKQEAAQRLQAMHEAARVKAAHEAAVRAKAEAEARVRAEIEAAARAQQEREEKHKREAEIARLKTEEEAALVKAELDAAAKAKAEAEAARLKAEEEAARAKAELLAAKARAEAEAKALVEARIRQEAEEKARREAEAARLKAEAEAARAKAELEAAKARAEAEAKALNEARIRKEAEEKARREAEAARLKAEAEAARVKAELEAAKARAEAEAKALNEARIRKEAEEQARREAEAARLKAEEAARIKAENEAIAKARAEAEAKQAAEVLARKQEADAAAKREAEERANHAAASVKPEKSEKRSTSAPAFEIKLDDFLAETEPVNQIVEPAVQSEAQASAESEASAVLEAEQHATAKAKEQAEKDSLNNAAIEMARLKEEAEAARRKAEEIAHRQMEEQAMSEEQARIWAEAEQRAKAQAALELEQSAQQVALLQAKAAKTAVVRKPGKPLPWGKFILGLVVLALAAIIVLPYVYPLNDYIAPLERRLSAQLRQPVHIGGLSASSLPPKLQLQNVTLGSAQEVKVGTVELNFDLFSLPAEVKIISNAELDDVSIDGRLLDKLAASFKLLGSDVNYPVRHLTLQRVKIVSDEVVLPDFSGIAEIDAQGILSRVSLHSADDKLGIDLQSNQGRWQLGVNLKERSLPVFPDVVFSDLSAKGDLSDGEVNFTEMDAHIYNGILLGNGKLSWNKGWHMQGTLEAKTFDLDKMFPKFHIEGEMYGDATYSMSGAKLSQMDDDPQLDGTFTVKKGTLNFDIVETARLLSRDNLVGGRTHFDDMIGQVQLDKHTVHVRQLKIISGMLSANGSFDVSPGNQLAGVLNAEIKLRAGNNQLTLYGNLAEQKLRAGR
jgi:hypothetical protein